MGEKVNVIVVGAGPAGVAAAIYLKRADWEPLLLDEKTPGGLLREASLVENYPGFPKGIIGADLANLMVRQIEELRVRFEKTRVLRIAREETQFVTKTEGQSYVSEAVILAIGTTPKRSTIEGQEDVIGRVHHGLSSFDLDRAEGTKVAVLGGGDAAFDYAINLANRGGAVTVISRSTPVCLPLLSRRAKAKAVEVIDGYEPVRFERLQNGVKVSFTNGKTTKETICDSVIVAYGREPTVEVLDEGLRACISESRSILPRTCVDGFFAAGDVVRGTNRQASIAVGDGTLAAMMVDRLFTDRGVER